MGAVQPHLPHEEELALSMSDPTLLGHNDRPRVSNARLLVPLTRRSRVGAPAKGISVRHALEGAAFLTDNLLCQYFDLGLHGDGVVLDLLDTSRYHCNDR